MSAGREAILVKSWMSHDARWFNAVAREFGIEAANRVNQAAARDAARVEAQRARRDHAVGPASNAGECVRALDELVSLLGGRTLLEYEAAVRDPSTFSLTVHRCFAHENVTRAGIAERYDCGIFARVEGWLEGLGCAHRVEPALKGCLKAQGAPCVHRVQVQPGAFR